MLEHLQCPKCGASLNPEGRADLFCSYCGARLKIQAGASGNPMAVLDDIKEDTSLLAKQALITHLQSQIQEMGKERAQLVQEEAVARVDATSYVGIVIWIFGFLIGVKLSIQFRRSVPETVIWGIIAGFCLLVGLKSFYSGKAENEEREAWAGELQRQIAALDGKIGEAGLKLQDLKDEIDQIAKGE